MQFDSCHGTTFLDFEDVRVPKSNLIGQEGGRVRVLALAVRMKGTHFVGIMFYSRCDGGVECKNHAT